MPSNLPDLRFSSHLHILPKELNAKWQDIFPNCLSLADLCSVHFLQWLTKRELKLHVNSMIHKDTAANVEFPPGKLTVVISFHVPTVIRAFVFV
jgi:hypothetical protein